ncbi:MAG: archease [Sandaracinaceae bacterium]|nr:archease [Sandaracinaceae bacterium]
MRSHRFFDHTGDFGADLEASSEAELFEASVDALVGLLVDDATKIDERESRPIEARGVDGLDQLVALGNEVLYAFETGWLARRVEVIALDVDTVTATAWGEAYDPARHVIARPVKAVTHHGAAIDELDDDRWTGRLVFDL